MKKLLLTAGLVSMLALAACGEDTQTEEDSNASNQEDTEETTLTDNSDEEEATDDEEAADEDPEDVIESDWETQVGETDANGNLLLLGRNDTIDTIETGPMTLNIPQVNIAEVLEWPEDIAEFYDFEPTGVIQIDMEVSNSSEDTVNFYPDQATITTSTGEQLESDVFTSDYIDGEFIGAVNKKGSVFFLLENSDPNEVEWVRILINSPHDNESFDTLGDEVDFQVDFN
ncbi:hypothetical protein [Alkalicoccobacillus porphyridii]|uniref:DUF4352 domain-containing protein n=1 Tax=Alkalicoccobacillus porphyridii TaxID=2597270 RepID=A0A553ZTX4_9BACI|nr:hypothetical protein [Alkalicoccobacillus porphyridii]TSB44918.1 hypothetical protein FN960_18905 [Alkalicoccobacillus porphyridii]